MMDEVKGNSHMVLPARVAEKPYTLPRAEQWIPGESVIGLLVRNTRPQGFVQPSVLLTRIRTEKYVDALGVRHLEEAEAQAFADLLGMERASFDLMHHGSPEPNTARLFGHVVHAEYVSLSRRRACPLCLEDSPHHRAIWNFSLLTVCPEHGVPLVERCQECSRLLTWTTPSVTTCSRLSCLAPIEPVSGAAPETELGGVRGLVATITGQPPPEAPAWPVNSIIRFTFALGKIASGGGRSRPIGVAQKQPELLPAILDAGWKAVANWPVGFRKLMADLRTEAANRPGRWGLKKEFGSLAALIQLLADDPAGQPLLAEFSAFVAAEPDLATRAHDILKKRTDAGNIGNFVTCGQAARLLKMNVERVSALATERDLWLVAPTGSGAASLIKRDKLLELAERIPMATTKTGAAEILNTSKGTFRDIEALGLLVQIPDEERPLPELLYRRADVAGFLAKLEALAPLEAADGALVTPDTLARNGTVIAEILSAVLHGKLRPAAIDKKARGLHRLLFDPLTSHRILVGAKQTMSTVEASLILGVKDSTAYLWVRRGLIASTPGATKAEFGYRITQEALDAFKTTYVTGTEVAKKLGLRARWVSVKLEASGIQPVSGPRTDGSRQLLFLRTDVENARLHLQVGRSNSLEAWNNASMLRR
jgi:hypothetical protein